MSGADAQTERDTIAAIATARGEAALAVVRVSGPDARAVADARFRGDDLTEAESHTAHVGTFVDAKGAPIDEVVVTVFEAPRSSTGEHVAEVSCHGGDTAPQLVLRALLEAGARMAEPGEFTERAFLNGKMDLAQAEAVAELIHSGSSLAHRVSMSHLKGRYSEALEEIREELMDLCGLVELELDFAEEDVEFADRSRLEELLDHTDELLSELLESYQVGSVLRDGVRVVIGGRPNAGKSTLLNALVGEDRAIVSETPGTTRDEIEAETEIEGVRYRFVDTAGLRDTEHAIEAEGVRRARASIEGGDVLLYVYDVTEGLDEEERAFIRELAGEEGLSIVGVANKADLAPEPAGTDGAGRERASASRSAPAQDEPGRPGTPGDLTEPLFENGPLAEGPHLRLSALEGRTDRSAIEPLEKILADLIAATRARADASPIVTNQRHRQHLANAQEAVRSARETLEERHVMGDLLAIDLREAMDELGKITGEVTSEDVLGHIFSQFCIGK